MKTIKFGDIKDSAQIGDKVELQGQTQEVVACQQTGVPMLNIDANQLKKGDLSFIKKIGLTISNPDTDKPIALGVDYKPETWGHKIKDFFEADASPSPSEDLDSDDDSDDDSSFFGAAGAFLGGSSSWSDSGVSSGGGFGGFGGGSFSGGGATASF